MCRVYNTIYDEFESPQDDKFLCPWCTGSKKMDWVTGTIAEANGPAPNNKECEFVITGGDLLIDRMSLVVLTTDLLNLRSDYETLEIWGGSQRDRYLTIRKGDPIPPAMPMVPPVHIRVSIKGALNDDVGIVLSPPGSLRFQFTFVSYSVGQRGASCVRQTCLEQPGCIAVNSCLDVDGQLKLAPNA